MAETKYKVEDDIRIWEKTHPVTVTSVPALYVNSSQYDMLKSKF